MSWKDFLKRNSVVFEANARLKSWLVLRRYRSLVNAFSPHRPLPKIFEQQSVAELVQDRMESLGRRPVKKKKGALRMIFIGMDYKQDSSGILQALARFGEVLAFEGKPGTYGALRPRNGLLSAREENSRRLVEEVRRALREGPVDIVLGQMWGFTFRADALQHVREMGPVVVNISMDDRHAYRGKRIGGEWTGTSGLIKALDLAATAAPECCSWYFAEGCPAIYFPEASDPEFFKPFPGEKLYDVCFVGANYGIRREIVGGLRDAGIQVAAFGKGWPNGMIDTEQVPELFSRSRVVLGIGTIGYTKDLYSLKMRDFDGPMSGSLYLTHYNPDLESLYEIGKEIDTYRNGEECVRKVRFYLDNPCRAEEIGSAGRLRAQSDHTWEKRFTELLEAVGVLQVGDLSE
jgi:hypothetical protein